MDQIFQLAGALVILAAFVAMQLGRMSPNTRIYLWLNLVGSLVLAVAALIGEDWGFLVVETVWAVFSAWGLLRPSSQGDAPAHI